MRRPKKLMMSSVRSARPPTYLEAYRLPRLHPGDLVAVMMTGAYGAVMASAYNARPPAAEVLVKGAELEYRAAENE